MWARTCNIKLDKLHLINKLPLVIMSKQLTSERPVIDSMFIHKGSLKLNVVPYICCNNWVHIQRLQLKIWFAQSDNLNCFYNWLTYWITINLNALSAFMQKVHYCPSVFWEVSLPQHSQFCNLQIHSCHEELINFPLLLFGQTFYLPLFLCRKHFLSSLGLNF